MYLSAMTVLLETSQKIESAPLSILKSLQVAQVGFNRCDLFLLKSCNIAR